MEIKVQTVIDTYKEELAKLTNENILLKAQLRQIQEDSNQTEVEQEVIE